MLTDEQKAVLAEMEAELAQGTYPEKLIDARIARLTGELGLDASQQTALKDIFSLYGSRLLALR